jgi:pentatricopeptide repeat protein
MSLAGGKGEEEINMKMVLGKHKASIGEVIPALELFVKDHKYLKVIQMLKEHEELFQTHEDFRNKILDIIFTRITQNGAHYAASAVGSYLLSLEMYEKACLVFMKAGDHVRAQWIATTHNMTHVMRAVERSYSDLGKGSLTHLESEEGMTQPIQKLSRQKSIVAAEHSLASLVEARLYDKACGFIADMTSDYQITTDDIASLKAILTDHKTQLLKLTAKKAAKLGHFEMAIELYSELKENKKLLKTMIKGKMVPKIIQFANFSREEELLVMAADALQNFPVQFKDVVFNAIINLYVKAKRFGKAVDFLRNYSVELFESGAWNDCFECLEKSEKILPKLREEEVRNYVEMLKDDRSFLSQFGMAMEGLRDGNESEAFNILADLYRNHRGSLYGCCKAVVEQLFVASVRVQNRESAMELAGMVARGPSALKKLLKDSDYQVYMKMSGGAAATGPLDNDGIEEELD